MGLALTRHLVQNGWRVAMCDMNEEQGKEHAEKLGASSLFVKVDVTDYDQQAQAFQLVWERWGQLDFGKSECPNYSRHASNVTISSRGKCWDP